MVNITLHSSLGKVSLSSHFPQNGHYSSKNTTQILAWPQRLYTYISLFDERFWDFLASQQVQCRTYNNMSEVEISAPNCVKQTTWWWMKLRNRSKNTTSMTHKTEEIIQHYEPNIFNFSNTDLDVINHLLFCFKFNDSIKID